MTRTDALIGELHDARAAMLAAVDRIDPRSQSTPGVIGEWSVRELIAHLGYWVGHAVDTLHAVEDGRADDVGAEELPVDEVNETVARVARETDLATVRKREAASVEALVTWLGRMEPSLLDFFLPDGQTLEAAIREDGPQHYLEHAEALVAVLDARRDA
jgi:hypothetical protein